MEIYEWIAFLTVFGSVEAHNPFAGCMKENTYGYGYLEYFPVEVLPEASPDGRGPLDPKAKFYMEFYVRASQNAHILLAEHNHDAVGLEILLGGSANTFSQIRRLNHGSRKSLKTIRITETVSDKEDKGFWIELDSLDNLLVGRRGESEPFLYYHNTISFPVRYFSFATWTNVKGVWHFACPRNPSPDADDEERNITTERLRNDLFTYYNPSNFPAKDGNPSQTVQLHLEANDLRLDEKRGQLEFSGMAHVMWNDWKLMWNPQDYDNIHAIHVNQYFLWTPKIKVLNSATFEKTSFLTKRGSVSIKSNGEVSWRAPFHSVTFCFIGYKKWPYNRYNCTLIIGFSTEILNINIDTVVLTTLLSKWEIQNPEENGTASYLDEERGGVIQFHLQRRNPTAIIRNLIVPPFLTGSRTGELSGTVQLFIQKCAATLTLLSFWVNPNSFVKLFLCCGSVFILIVSLIILGDTLPAVLSSETAGFYHTSVFFYCFPILFFIGLKYLPDSINLSRFTADFLNTRMNKTLFCLPKIPQEQPGKFISRGEAQRSNNAFLLSILYERLIFLIYLICFLLSFIIALIFLEIIL